MITCNKCKIQLFNCDIVQKKLKITKLGLRSSDLEFAIFRCPKCFNTIRMIDKKELHQIELRAHGV